MLIFKKGDLKKNNKWEITNNLGKFSTGNLTGENKLFGVNNIKEKIFVNNLEKEIKQNNFIFDLFPEFNYNIDNKIHIKKKFIMPKTYNALVISYKIISDLDAYIEFEFDVEGLNGNNKIVSTNTEKKLIIGTDNCEFSKGKAFFNIKNGLNKIDFLIVLDNKKEAFKQFDDLFTPNSKDYEKFFDYDSIRIDKIVEGFCNHYNIAKDDFIKYLIWNTDNFSDPKTHGNLRNTLIGFEGLYLIPLKYEEAMNILLQMNDDIFKSADLPLLFILDAHKYYNYTKDLDLIHKLFKRMDHIIKSYINGSNPMIYVGHDGLVFSGDSKNNLSWMKSDFFGSPLVTRYGKLVEINAMWYNCLNIMNFFSGLLNKEQEYDLLINKVKESFENEFSNYLGKYLYDYTTGYKKDGSIRPNQLFAISLPYSILPKNKEILILKKINKDLLTPYGLRSLDINNNKFRGLYDSINKKKAYYNGCVHPWLLGAYVDAYLKLHDTSKFAKNEIKVKILNIIKHNLKEYGVACFNELYDGEIPFEPRGRINYPISVAEILRCYTNCFR